MQLITVRIFYFHSCLLGPVSLLSYAPTINCAARPGRGLPHKNDRGACRTLGVKKAVLVPLRVFSICRSTAGALAVRQVRQVCGFFYVPHDYEH